MGKQSRGKVRRSKNHWKLPVSLLQWVDDAYYRRCSLGVRQPKQDFVEALISDALNNGGDPLKDPEHIKQLQSFESRAT